MKLLMTTHAFYAAVLLLVEFAIGTEIFRAVDLGEGYVNATSNTVTIIDLTNGHPSNINYTAVEHVTSLEHSKNTNVSCMEIKSHLLRTLQYRNESSIYERDTESQCDDGYYQWFTNKVSSFMSSKDHSLKWRVLQSAWTGAVSFVGLGADATKVWSNLGGTLKSAFTPQACTGGSKYINIQNSAGTLERTYLVGWAPYKCGGNKCDTTVTADQLTAIFKQEITDSLKNEYVSWCASMTHGGTWRASVRFLLWENQAYCHQNLWDIPCEEWSC
ncbi:LADA_0H12596g1_1 [Lachancea dasiensis]|uniref:LADA_0H12596g1_1 n=1 Tax=Lachancea dasiensis TaxID=1072105 RepID=A0A1G4K431_9SACH|nr:LADA_0H12596g1_1 [Lachancea dasiensis]